MGAFRMGTIQYKQKLTAKWIHLYVFESPE